MAPSMTANAFGRLYSFWLFCRSDFTASHVCCVTANVEIQRQGDATCSLVFCRAFETFESEIRRFRQAQRYCVMHDVIDEQSIRITDTRPSVVVIYDRVVAMWYSPR